jgi:hypothetical protein
VPAALALFLTVVFCGPLRFVRAGGGLVFSQWVGLTITEEQPELRVVDLVALRAEELAGQEVDLLLEKLYLLRLARDGLLRSFDG